MKYKINEVSKITNVSVETIRYYEKIGLITPEVDESNRYRYYSPWDINFILDYNIYRKLEYSSKEALHFIYGANLEEQTQMLELKAKFYQNQIEHYQLLQKRNENLIRHLCGIKDNLNKITIEAAPARKYIRYRKNYDFYGYKYYKEEIDSWLAKHEMTDNAIIIPQSVISDRMDNNYEWSLMVDDNLFRTMDFKVFQNVECINPGLCVKTLVETGGEGTFHYTLLDSAMEYIRRHNFRLNGDPYGILLIRSHDQGEIHRYFTFYLPICE